MKFLVDRCAGQLLSECYAIRVTTCLPLTALAVTREIGHYLNALPTSAGSW